MKLSEAPSKIIGVHLGEATLNLIREGQAPLKAKFALITKEGEPCGFMDMEHGWSEKAIEALRVFAAALEEEALVRISDSTPKIEPAVTPEERSEPSQF